MATAFYRNGTVAVTQGSKVITGTGTNWTTGAVKPLAGDVFIFNDKIYEVEHIISDTEIRLFRNFEDATATGQAYVIIRNASLNISSRIAAQVAQVVNQKQILLTEFNNWMVSISDHVIIHDSVGDPVSLIPLAKLLKDVGDASSQLDVIRQYVAEAKAARDKAKQWADAPEGTAVETGKFSAKHWAAKSQEHADAAKVIQTDVTAKGSQATQDAATASAKATIATAKAGEATASASEAQTEANKAKQERIAAGVSADKAEAATDLLFLMSESEARAIQWQNENVNFDASGMVNAGKAYNEATSAVVTQINEGMWSTVQAGSENTINIGRSTNAQSGSSKTEFAVTHIAGAVANITTSKDYTRFKFEFPQAPDGTVTYNKSTGENIKHPDVATAFALADSDVNIEVVTHPVDLAMFEYYEEELTGRQEIFECIQSLSTTFGDTDVPTVLSTRPLSYFQQYDGQFPDPTLQNNQYRCVVWSDLTDEQKRNVATYMGEKLFMGENGHIVNGRLRARTIRGAGNGDWLSISERASGTLGYDGILSSCVIAQGNGDVLVYEWANTFVGTTHSANNEKNDGVFEKAATNYAYKGRCFAYVVATVPRANQGIYIKGLNEYGTAKCSDDKSWYESVNKPTTLKDCFIGQVGGDIASGKSGHPDGIFYDGIEAGGLNGIIDWRLSAYPVDTKEEGSKGFSKVEDGSYRGLEKLVKTYVEEFAAPAGSYESNSTTVYLDSGATDKFEIGDTLYVVNSTDNSIAKGTIKVKGVSGGYSCDFITFDGDEYDRVGGTVYYTIVSTKTNLSVSGEFNTQMVIGDPANIPQDDELKFGWLGTWCQTIPNGLTDQGFPATRKIIGGSSMTRFINRNDGNGWVELFAFNSDAKNWVAATVDVGDMVIAPYPAFAKQTKPSTNKPVLNGSEGLLGIFVTQSFDKSVLTESVANVILTSDASGIVTEQSSAVKYLIDDMIERIKTLPNEMVAPTNSSQAVKVAVYQISENGQMYLGFVANTMTHNGTDWGELEEMQVPSGSMTDGTFIDSNGTTQTYHSRTTSIPHGWSQNKARFGTVTDGVDQ